MQPPSAEKTLRIARYILRTGATVRAAAEVFGMSKSAVHKQLQGPLRAMHPGLYQEVKQVMEYHKAVKHLRGGQATKQKYENIRARKTLPV